MSFLKKVKEIGGDLADSGKRSAQRGKLELEVRRLEGKINDEKNGIGQAVFPLLEAGTLTIENEVVAAHMAKIAELAEDLAGKRRDIDALGEDDGDEKPVAESSDTAAAG
jgi:hypothetical protein